MIPIPSFLQKLLMYLVVAVALVAAGYVKGCVDKGVELTNFKANVAAAAKAREEQNEKERKTRDAITKAKDESHAAERAADKLALDRVRAAARRSAVPPAPEGTRRPDLACFDRAELDRAIGEFRSEVAELVGEGSACAVDLNAAKAWWQEQSRIAQ